MASSRNLVPTTSLTEKDGKAIIINANVTRIRSCDISSAYVTDNQKHYSPWYFYQQNALYAKRLDNF